MPQYRFSEFSLSTDSGELTIEQQSLTLDAKSFQVLSYFCQNPDRIISRDELLEYAWPNIVVSDNTVNKLIANLRKLLNDDAKQPKFIQTVPKKGYRFICPVQLEEPKPEVIETLTEPEKPNSVMLFALVAFLVLSAVWLIWGGEKPSSSDITTLTRIDGDKQSALVSRNGRQLAFVNQQNHQHQLWLNDLQSNKLKRISHDYDSIQQLFYFYSPDKLMLLVKKDGHLRLVEAGIKGDNLTTVRTFPVILDDYWAYDINYHPYSKSFYFVGTEKSGVKKGLFHIDENSNEVTSVPLNMSPNDLLLKLDISRDQKKILLLSQLHDNSTDLYSFDIEQQSAKLYHKFDGLIRNAIWHHNNEGIYYNDTPPAQRIVSIERPGAMPEVIASSSEYLCCELSRVPASEDLIYRTNIRNYSIEIEGEKAFNVENSPIYDMTPALFHLQSAVAFISKRSGKSQLYIQTPGKAPQQISDFANYKVISHMEVSADDSAILLSEGNRVHLFDLNQDLSLKSAQQREFDEHLFHVSWLNDRAFSISLSTVKNSRVEIYSSDFTRIRSLETIWMGLLKDDKSPDRLYLVDNDFKLYQTSLLTLLAKQPLVPNEIKQLMKSRLRDIRIEDGRVYQKASGGNGIDVSSLSSDGVAKKIAPETQLYGFDVVDKTIAISKLKYASSDLHMTRRKGK